MAMRDAFRRAGFQVPDEPDRRDEMARRPNQPNRSGRGGQGRQRGNRPPPKLPNMPRFSDSYFGKDSKDRPYLLPEFVSKGKVDTLARRLANENPRLTTGQARRFFNHCREIERRLMFDESWEEVSASFESLSFHAQNAASSRPSKIPRGFQTFIDENVRRVTSSEDPERAFIEGFLPHFEALMGYGSAHMRDR